MRVRADKLWLRAWRAAWGDLLMAAQGWPPEGWERDGSFSLLGAAAVEVFGGPVTHGNRPRLVHWGLAARPGADLGALAHRHLAGIATARDELILLDESPQALRRRAVRPPAALQLPVARAQPNRRALGGRGWERVARPQRGRAHHRLAQDRARAATGLQKLDLEHKFD